MEDNKIINNEDLPNLPEQSINKNITDISTINADEQIDCLADIVSNLDNKNIASIIYKK
ncbi:MAG: hypothetical protein PHQ89_02515 [Bacilli bacterium]|nr:hypothetical protein [Bacilli bacterium]